MNSICLFLHVDSHHFFQKPGIERVCDAQSRTRRQALQHPNRQLPVRGRSGQAKKEIPNFGSEPVYDVAGRVEKYLFDPADPFKVVRRNPALQPKV